MFYRNIYISNYGTLSIKNKNFLFTDKNNLSTTIPIDDINSIIIDTPLVKLTSIFISLCGENNIVLYVCNKQHVPNVILLPFAKHSKWLETLQQQIQWKKPYKKRLWKQIIERKILNQKFVLDYVGKNSFFVNAYIGKVKSDDSGNIEAIVANFYFKELFGKNFIRRDEKNNINALLNYGYAIIRGNIARSISAYGYIPALGLHHKNVQNSFNLADDLIEPLRPLVDLTVFELVHKNPKINIQDKDTKIQLIKILEKKVKIQNNIYQIPNCIEIMVSSLKNETLKLPFLIS